jgi:NADH:ubiquinone oxidoreductase subunit 4 (subunit M)
MLRAYKAVFLGEKTASASSWTDLSGPARFALAALPVALLLAGFFPQYFLGYLKPTLEAALR